MSNSVTNKLNFYGNTTPFDLIEKYGSPLYVYNENILKEKCRELMSLVSYPNFSVNYSVKANSNLELLKIVCEEGLNADAMSPGEIFVNIMAGYKPENILYISNNVDKEEMQYAIDAGVTVSVDSVSQLALFGKLNPGGKVCIRFNPGVGAGHHEKVITGGKKTKFGVDMDLLDDVKDVLKKYDLKLIGINQHIGSLFMEGDSYVEGVKSCLSIAENFSNLEFIDLGGGFGIPYHKLDGESRLDLADLGSKLTPILTEWANKYGSNVKFKFEPGRYIVAESSVLLGTVNAIKTNYSNKYAGTDLGFNVLARPIMYDSHHDIEVYSQTPSNETEPITVVGNICESGDIIAKDRILPVLNEGDILGVLDAGAYGYCMSSNYNNRLRPAEVLIQSDGTERLIRRRDTLQDLIRNFQV
ncbi:MAG: lysA [Clostridiales bacterium]|jgi:diaminopimelate decarboxylase|nr:lysA [Clostridiales bacterium]